MSSTHSQNREPDRAYLALSKRVTPLISRGDYARALMLVRDSLESAPDDFYRRFLYAKVVGDWADELPPAKQKKFKSESIRILESLMKELRGRSVLYRWRIPLNLCYQTENWARMYRLGKRFSRIDRGLAHYTKGLAATSLAQKSKGASRVVWAKKALKFWRAYDMANEDYYFAHYMQAKAYAFSGDLDLAAAALKRAAKLGKRPISDWEFKDVFALINSRNRVSSK